MAILVFCSSVLYKVVIQYYVTMQYSTVLHLNAVLYFTLIQAELHCNIGYITMQCSAPPQCSIVRDKVAVQYKTLPQPLPVREGSGQLGDQRGKRCNNEEKWGFVVKNERLQVKDTICFVLLGSDIFEENALIISIFFLNESYSWCYGAIIQFK